MVGPGDAEHRREADAAVLALGAHEGLEDALLGVEVDPRSVVGHANEGVETGRTVTPEDEAATRGRVHGRGPRRDADHAAPVLEHLAGVHDQVQDRLSELRGIAEDSQLRAAEVELQRHLGPGLGLEAVGRVPHDLVQVE